jgi:uncharacterized protein YbjT (DUF2867 family)
MLPQAVTKDVHTGTSQVHGVFIAGVTGYMGTRLTEALLRRGHRVAGLVRPGSEKRIPAGCQAVSGNALDRNTFSDKIGGNDTFVQLVGVAHPSPAKAQQFRDIDLKSCRESVAAAAANHFRHFVYVSVAHPAPAMKAYIAVRTECEEIIRGSGLKATILRPWYVLGPGHNWPYLLVPGYWLARKIPKWREGALRLGLVTLSQMISVLVGAVETPSDEVRMRTESRLHHHRIAGQ